ncbi:SRPBCC family protein [Candidatus Poriferisocius sp.]|uniref:SRPBCC family protein n=1 Tax=Candidatus Poriferisocius sp. TaxID=3101276 RepID=UPI003B01400C
MEMTNQIEVNASVDEVWDALNDVERIAPCLPGAQLTEVEGEEYRGVVKIKVGPINAQYKGKATFVERDRDALKVVILAEGRETRGQGNASAQITAALESLGEDRTGVGVTTELKITGKVAQIGRNLIPDVSAKLMDRFAENLESLLSAPAGDEAVTQDVESAGDEAVTQDVESAPIDLLDVAGPPAAKRLGPIAGVIAGLWILRKLFKRKKKKKG